ncbi:HlyIII-domain-containing protein [Dendrothele bispora CBS 962.96]|uniref:HlyIII-domain-containing protein n=1 Tax=Dendrothele bispora (strain CBS 962.96) TaxID=1314807 RepID=A0A4S8MVK8_DENBC|nr:HlyIII-domain-containing protein [Dendrothele bispora CBS 962.96]
MSSPIPRRHSISAPSVPSRNEVRLRRNRRRQSTPAIRNPSPRLHFCKPLPPSLEALDLSSDSNPSRTLASLRFLVLSYIADVERRLSTLESPDLESWITKGEFTIEEARQSAKTTLDMLQSLRDDVCYNLPDLHLSDISIETLRSHLPHLPDVPSINEVRSHLPDMPDVLHHFPDLQDMRSKLDDVRTRFHEMDFHKPLDFIPTLSERLQSLQFHLSAMEMSSGLRNHSSMLFDLVDSLLSSELVSDILHSAPDLVEGEDMFERAAREVTHAVKRSLQGVRLISYSDLPEQWRNNPFVTRGYRFIPIERWPLILMSLFAFHNEFLNIHTHLIPGLLWFLNSIPFVNPTGQADMPEKLFMAFALLCLFSSAVWHTMAGCAHPASMEFCARVDYVGIGWLISASVGTVVHYGFQCHPTLGKYFLGLCFLTGLAGNIVPFTEWFNRPEYRGWRIVFFLTLAFSSLAPLATLEMLHSIRETLHFMAPVSPSLVSYLIGLAFYASHVPERFLPQTWSSKLDIVGGGSHCIWHCFIVLAVSQHKAAIQMIKDGIQCAA